MKADQTNKYDTTKTLGLVQVCSFNFEARSTLSDLYIWDRQHILAPVLEDEHAKTVASSSEHHIVYPRSLSRATSVEPRSHHETTAFRGHTHRLWTSSSTSTALPASTTRRSSLSRLYWWSVLLAVRTRRWKGSSKRRRTTTSTTEVKNYYGKKKSNQIKSENRKAKRGGGAEDSVIAPAPQTTFHTLYQSIALAWYHPPNG